MDSKIALFCIAVLLISSSGSWSGVLSEKSCKGKGGLRSGRKQQAYYLGVGGSGKIGQRTLITSSLYLSPQGNWSSSFIPSISYRLYSWQGPVFYLKGGLGGAITSVSGETEFSLLSELGLQGTYRLNYEWGLQGEISFLEEFNSDNRDVISPANWGLSIVYYFKKDSDNDGIPDNIDECLNTPPYAEVDKEGCGIDADGDGVYTGKDECPQTPFAAIVDSLGCPKDADGDGVYNGIDRCPETPKDIDVNEFGCPLDSDSDSIPNYKDSCDATPEGAIVDKFGCPSDSDEDGVYDGIDKCPKTPTGFEVNDAGCPDIKPIKEVVIHNFFDDNVNIKGEAAGELAKACERIRAYPEVKVDVYIHTDVEGSDVYNLNRARKLGSKIKAFMLKKGVFKNQIHLIPRGQANPLSNKLTQKAKRLNRRIIITRREE